MELYNKRKESGLSGIVNKLILNSLYGVFAETRKYNVRIDDLQTVKQYKKKIMRTMRDKAILLLARHCRYARKHWMKECACKWCNDARRLARFASLQREKDLFNLDKNFYIQKEINGRYNNLILAAWITAEARLKLWRILKKCNADDVVAVFTDSILTRKNCDKWLVGKERLGDWSKKEFGKGIVVGCGVYQIGRTSKFRGFAMKKSLRQVLQTNNGNEIRICQTRRNSLGKLTRQGFAADERLNEIIEDEKFLNLNFDRKRLWPEQFKDGKDVLHKRIKSEILIDF
jgi:hypothetical protein